MTESSTPLGRSFAGLFYLEDLLWNNEIYFSFKKIVNAIILFH